VGAVFYYLSKYLNTRISLMTATNLKILELAYQQILLDEGEPEIDYGACELLQEHEEIYRSYRSTKIVPLLEIKYNQTSLAQTFIEKVFSIKWNSDQSCQIGRAHV